ncbi:penicillin-binding protein 1A [Microcoleus sp. FACHB-831]|uniref:transglycosylase domain-containing protein n=1 Tax=Microcoleus sp. FACHB-831 TaxID=2692827 RepID=UPI0016873A35|nr:penicillin-binding protein 1A [Microcoleus sp. FACHB-831]MBD1920489.1 penicillin-binding protein 1A [Microcoleus sp. FACHB-831]
MSSSTIDQKQPQEPSPPIFKFAQGVGKVTGGTLLGITMLTSSVIAGGLVGLAISFRNLPDVRVLRTYAPTETTYIYDIKGKQLASIHGEANREVVPLNKISPNLKRAVLAIEDSHFYLHHGINPNSVARALRANWEKGSVVEGGSTITMQLVKNLFLSQKRAVSRKVAESVLAIRLEQIFSKNQILEMYLNQVYWGHNNYGVQTASQSYFGKKASELTLGEAAMMAGMIQAPEEYSPFVNYKIAKQRQALVLSRMREVGWITPQDEAAALKQTIKRAERTSWKSSELPYITDAVLAELNKRFGADIVQKGGMRVQTTIDATFQQMAERKVSRWHNRLESYGVYNNEIALVAVDPRTHFVKAMVGGVNRKKSQFNRATQSRRQPGSAFKPFVFYTAFASGKYTPNSWVYDGPISYRDGGGYYSPRNYGGGYSGGMSIREALRVSQNVPAVIIGRKVGLDKVIATLRTIGFESPIEPVVSLPLGAVGVTPLEMAGGYAAFASNGWYSPTTFIARVTDSSGNVLLDNTPKPKLVLDPWAAASVTSTLQGVVTSGTGKNAQIGRPAAGKTGTTSSEKDVWFVGYVPQLSTAVWIGKDNNRSLGGGITGGVYAAPIWRDFMATALKGTPVEYFPSPSKFERP